MFPFGNVLYLPISSSTATSTSSFLRPIPTELSSSSSSLISLYNPTILNNPFNAYTQNTFEHNVRRQKLTHRLKRIHDDSYNIQKKKRPKLSSVIIRQHPSRLSKNALMRLHELKPSIEYKLIAKTGPSHRPMFTMAVELNGQIFHGKAQTKKEAKQAAAENALQSFSELSCSLSNNTTNKFLSKTIDNDLLTKTNIESNIIESSDNPFYLLTQLQRNIKYAEIINENTSESKEFKIIITINDQQFIGIDSNKIIAKTKAAEYALEKLFGMCFHKKEREIILDIPSTETNNLSCFDRAFADQIASCIHEKFQQLAENDIRLQRRKVLCGIVLLQNYNFDTKKVICITTGTKCTNNSRFTRNGQTLNDCHAEILARRCLIRYCYEQLKLLFDEQSIESIFEKLPDNNRYKLKSSITFHLYISTAPCGDSRLCSQQDLSCEQSSLLIGNESLRKSRGLLRRKIEVSEGTIPILAKTMYRNVQAWNELCTNTQLSIMSCSDKLCRWNFIGLQGALLSTLIDPIYYTSYTIGSLYNSEHIRRALFSRIEHKIDSISTPYGLRKPFISDTTKKELRMTTRPPNYAFVWICIDEKTEIIDCFNGLKLSREPSMLSKAALFHQWIDIMNRIQLNTIPKIYHEAKQLAVDYQIAKMKVNQAFEHSGSGQWIKKPSERDEFDLSVVKM